MKLNIRNQTFIIALRMVYSIVSIMGKGGIRLLCIYLLIAVTSCTKRTTVHEGQHYTQIDSLTDTYLNLQDSLLITWNVMVKDENEKLRSMHEVLLSMGNSALFSKDQIELLEQRLEQVERIRFNQKTMSNPHVVEEYDFASNSLISEIISLAESNPSFVQQRELQSIVDYIKVADQRVEFYRSDYDLIAQKFNLFLDTYESKLKEIDQHATNDKRPLFQVASDN